MTDEVTTLNFLYCHEDLGAAARIGVGMMGLFGVSNSHLLWTREAYPTRAYQSLANLAPGRSGDGPASDPHGIPETVCIGDPDRIVGVLKRWEGMGLTGINFLVNAQEMIDQAAVLESMRLFAHEVMPHFEEAA